MSKAARSHWRRAAFWLCLSPRTRAGTRELVCRQKLPLSCCNKTAPAHGRGDKRNNFLNNYFCYEQYTGFFQTIYQHLLVFEKNIRIMS